MELASTSSPTAAPGTSSAEPASADGHRVFEGLHLILQELQRLAARQEELLQGQYRLGLDLSALGTSGTGFACSTPGEGAAETPLAEAAACNLALGRLQTLRPSEKPDAVCEPDDSVVAGADVEGSGPPPDEDSRQGTNDLEANRPTLTYQNRSVSFGVEILECTPETDSAVISGEGEVSHQGSINKDVRAHWTAAYQTENSMKKLNAAFVPIGTRDFGHLHQHGSVLLLRIVQHRLYDALTMFLILSNTIFIGVQVQRSADALPTSTASEVSDVEPMFFLVVETAFCVAFVVELAVRIGAFGRKFFTGLEWHWNIFDTLIVLVMLLEQVEKYWLRSALPLGQVSALRVLRAVRVVRTVRLLHVLKSLQGLRLLLHTVTIAVKSMVWTNLLVIMLLYIFGVCFAQGAVDFCAVQDCEASLEGKVLLHRFGGVWLSLLTLFQTMTNGVAWDELIQSLYPLGKFYTFLFVAYVTVACFAILNVVTGIFVETTMQVANQDRNEMIKGEMRAKEKYLQCVKEIFLEMDRDGSNSITLDEFKRALKDKRVVAYFNALQMDFTDIFTLFTLLDRDKNGSINLEEFMRGCMRLKGEAKTLDIAKLQYQSEWLMHNMVMLVDDVAEVKQAVSVVRQPSPTSIGSGKRGAGLAVSESKESPRITREVTVSSLPSHSVGEGAMSPRSRRRLVSQIRGEYFSASDAMPAVRSPKISVNTTSTM